MGFETTKEFEKDFKKLDANERKILKEHLQLIERNPESGKPMRHHANIFSLRIMNRRLIYEIFKEERIVLHFYKNRDEVYAYLR
ncbi:MAG: type II toxin-antitoxin system RelE/ParE family toxin [Candidatus Micrarchaeota archaeon]|nr:type II toxin-antitoxin system RelE/ParE family toxin [Candidatus Micrarchaeota archaeon]